MMQATGPVYCDVRLSVEQQTSGVNGGARRYLAEVVKPIKGWAIGGLSYFKLLPEF